jgi:hypothetical protein
MGKVKVKAILVKRYQKGNSKSTAVEQQDAAAQENAKRTPSMEGKGEMGAQIGVPVASEKLKSHAQMPTRPPP